ncbi:MAG: hypothetical protein KGI45_04305 [Patescibacteria group bacterium]|nr:hypothetical protein [Patescibacteria group bacterium]MDE1967255.1 hypothetical protein [Patescibacteria group bacterium]
MKRQILILGSIVVTAVLAYYLTIRIMNNPSSNASRSVILSLSVEKVVKGAGAYSWNGYLVHLMAKNEGSSKAVLITGLARSSGPTVFTIADAVTGEAMDSTAVGSRRGASASAEVSAEDFSTATLAPGEEQEIDVLHIRQDPEQDQWGAWSANQLWNNIIPSNGKILLAISGSYDPSETSCADYRRLFPENAASLDCSKLTSPALKLNLP